MIFVRAICCVFVLSLYISSALGATPCYADEAAVGNSRYCVGGVCASNVQYGVIYRGNCEAMAYARTVGDYCQPRKSAIQFTEYNFWEPTNTAVPCDNHIPQIVMVESEYFGHCYAVDSGDSNCKEEDNLVWNTLHFEYCCQPMVHEGGGLILDPKRLNQPTKKPDKFIDSLNQHSGVFADDLNLIRRHQDTAPQLPSLASQKSVTTKSLSTSQITEVQPRVLKTISSLSSLRARDDEDPIFNFEAHTACYYGEVGIGTSLACWGDKCVSSELYSYGSIFKHDCTRLATTWTIGDYCSVTSRGRLFGHHPLWTYPAMELSRIPTLVDVTCEDNIPKSVTFGEARYGDCYHVERSDTTCGLKQSEPHDSQTVDYCCKPMKTEDEILNPNRNQPSESSPKSFRRRDVKNLSPTLSPSLSNLHAGRDIESESSLHFKTPTSQRRPRAKRSLGDARDFIPCYQDEIALAIAQKCSYNNCFAKYVAMFKQDCQQVAYTKSIGGFCKPEENAVSVNHWWNPYGTEVMCDDQNQTPQILTFEGKYYGECYHADSHAPYCQNTEGPLWDSISIRYCCVPLVGSFGDGLRLDPNRIDSKPPKPAAPSLVIQDDPPNQ